MLEKYIYIKLLRKRLLSIQHLVKRQAAKKTNYVKRETIFCLEKECYRMQRSASFLSIAFPENQFPRILFFSFASIFTIEE